MRAKAFILSFLFLISFVAIKSNSIDWINPEYYHSVDDLIDSGNGNYNPSLTVQAQAARAAESGQPGREILTRPFGSNSSSQAATPQQAASREMNQTAATQPIAQDAPATNTPPIETRPVSVAGTWHLKIDVGTPVSANVTLVQSEKVVFGKGKITDENDTQTVFASGYVQDDVLSLDLVSENLRLYRLYLPVSGNSAEGSDTAYSSTGSPYTGQAKGLRS